MASCFPCLTDSTEAAADDPAPEGWDAIIRGIRLHAHGLPPQQRREIEEWADLLDALTAQSKD